MATLSSVSFSFTKSFQHFFNQSINFRHIKLVDKYVNRIITWTCSFFENYSVDPVIFCGSMCKVTKSCKNLVFRINHPLHLLVIFYKNCYFVGTFVLHKCLHTCVFLKIILVSVRSVFRKHDFLWRLVLWKYHFQIRRSASFKHYFTSKTFLHKFMFRVW